jgi:hypothetical protein
VDLTKAIKALFTKWILHALELGNPIYNVYLYNNYVNISLTKMGSGQILSYGASNHNIIRFPSLQFAIEYGEHGPKWLGK